MLSQSHHLARTRTAAAARYIARPGRGCRLVRTCAAAAAAVALLASACSTEEPPAPPVAQETTTTITTAPAGTATPAAPSPCTDPDAEDLGDGLVELDGVVFEVYADACVRRLEEPAGGDSSDAEATTSAASDEAQGEADVVIGEPVDLPDGFANHEHPCGCP